jgi:hypothetical protein
MIRISISVFFVYAMIFALVMSSGGLIDDFNDGDFDDWEVQAEDWEVENEEIKFWAASTCGASLYYEAGVDWTDYEFAVDIKLTSPSDFPGGIRVRLNPETGESYFTWVYPGQKVILSYVAFGWDCNNNGGIAAQAAWTPPEIGEWGRLGMVVKGDVIESWWNGEQILSFEDGSWENGTIALMTYNQYVYFDNAQVSGKGIPGAVEPEAKLATMWGNIKRGK